MQRENIFFSRGDEKQRKKRRKYLEKISPKIVKDIKKSRSRDFCQFLLGFDIRFGEFVLDNFFFDIVLQWFRPSWASGLPSYEYIHHKWSSDYKKALKHYKQAAEAAMTTKALSDILLGHPVLLLLGCRVIDV